MVTLARAHVHGYKFDQKYLKKKSKTSQRFNYCVYVCMCARARPTSVDIIEPFAGGLSVPTNYANSQHSKIKKRSAGYERLNICRFECAHWKKKSAKKQTERKTCTKCKTEYPWCMWMEKWCGRRTFMGHTGETVEVLPSCERFITTQLLLLKTISIFILLFPFPVRKKVNPRALGTIRLSAYTHVQTWVSPRDAGSLHRTQPKGKNARDDKPVDSKQSGINVWDFVIALPLTRWTHGLPHHLQSTPGMVQVFLR